MIEFDMGLNVGLAIHGEELTSLTVSEGGVHQSWKYSPRWFIDVDDELRR